MKKNENLNDTEQQLEEVRLLKESLYEKKENLKSFWNIFLRTGAIILAAIAVLVFLGIAWFVMNNWVNGGSAAISALGENRFALATLEDSSTKQGVYDANDSMSGTSSLAKALNRYFRMEQNAQGKWDYYKFFKNLPNLAKGTASTTIDGKTYILGDADGISLQVNSENNVNNMEEYEYFGPGSRGKITFYIIPYVNNLEKVNLSVSLKAFTLESAGTVNESQDAIGQAVPVAADQNAVLMKMLQGHILLFTGMDGNGNYSNRVIPEIDAEGRISFSFEKSGENWEKNKPVPITVYWIWPRRFENIKYYGQEGSVFKSYCDSHSDLLQWVNDNRGYIVNTNVISDTASLGNPSESMTNAQFARWSTGYNKGDQLIGENVAFIQWIIEAE